MAATVTYQRHSSIKVAVVDWVSDGAGAATATVDLDGQILKVVTNPGTAAPTDDYDITILDEDGIDIVQGLLANRDTINSEEVYPYKLITVGGTGTDRIHQPIYHAGPVTFTVANAGASKAGIARIYWR